MYFYLPPPVPTSCFLSFLSGFCDPLPEPVAGADPPVVALPLDTLTAVPDDV